MMEAVLSNADHPEYGVVTIPFPLTQDQYDDCIELLEKLGIGNSTKLKPPRDIPFSIVYCRFSSRYSALQPTSPESIMRQENRTAPGTSSEKRALRRSIRPIIAAKPSTIQR